MITDKERELCRKAAEEIGELYNLPADLVEKEYKNCLARLEEQQAIAEEAEALPLTEEQKVSLRERLGLALWGKISGFFEAMWEHIWSAFLKILEPITTRLQNAIFEFLFRQTPEDLTKTVRRYLDKVPMTPELKEDYEKHLSSTSVADIGLAVVKVIAHTVGTVMGIVRPLGELGAQNVNMIVKPTIPDMTLLKYFEWRFPETKDTIKNYLTRLGYSDYAQTVLDFGIRPLPDITQIRDLALRGEITDEGRKLLMSSLGYFERDQYLLEKLYWFIPSPTDLVRMAVREAFYPAYIAEYGLLQEYPAEFEEWAKKQGMTKYWAEKFWASHWELPSPLQGYEMLHRGVISDDQLDTLFVALDIMPWWRDKLRAISYAPYTRVDIRRMYRTGVVDRDEVYKTYRDLGYDHEHATNLTEFTVKDALEDERDLSKADVLAAFGRKLIDRGEAKGLLTEMKYSDEEAEIYLGRLEYDEVKKAKDKKLGWIKRNYVAGLVSNDVARDRLGALDLGGKEIEALFLDWDVEREGRMAELTFAQLQKLFIAKIITEGDFKSELEDKGYSDKYIEWLMKLSKAGKAVG